MSLTTRAIIAVSLMIGFYILSLAVAAGLLFLPYAQWAYFNSINLKLALICIGAAAAILISIVPRIDAFSPPGPRIDESQHPRLFAQLRQIATDTGQEMPAEAYLIPEVNAWVTQRGGIMGFGSRRVMGIGIPLLGLLSVSQFRAVIAHEFGHYYAGDTRLGPWIYKTRAALGRTVIALASRGSHLLFLFRGYANLFLRVTQAISRAQEFAADRLAAQVAGSNAMIEALQQIHRGAVAFRPYLESEVVPVLGAGYSPPLSGGFNQFLAVPKIHAQVEQALATELAEGKTDRFDTHPALAERITAIVKNPAAVSLDTRSATQLLEHFDAVDTGGFLAAPGTSLEPLPWEEVVERVYVRSWQAQVDYQAEALRGISAGQLVQQLMSGELRCRLKNPQGVWPTDAERGEMARNLGAVALSLALLRSGWNLHALPGEMYFEEKGRTVQPFEMVRQLSAGELRPDSWAPLCIELGIADLPLLATSAAATLTP